MILEHQAKSEGERRAANPREHLIGYWQKRVREVEARISHLEKLLRGD